jgi:hypothetical protein
VNNHFIFFSLSSINRIRNIVVPLLTQTNFLQFLLLSIHLNGLHSNLLMTKYVQIALLFVMPNNNVVRVGAKPFIYYYYLKKKKNNSHILLQKKLREIHIRTIQPRDRRESVPNIKSCIREKFRWFI